MEHFPYKTKLKQLGPFSLILKSQLRGDITEVYKIMHDAEKVDKRNVSPSPITLEFHNTRTQTHPTKLIGSTFNTGRRKYYFK